MFLDISVIYLLWFDFLYFNLDAEKPFSEMLNKVHVHIM